MHSFIAVSPMLLIMFRTILLSLALATSAWAECPDLESLDIMYNSDTFMCGYYWQEKGADNPIKVREEVVVVGSFINHASELLDTCQLFTRE